jgi:hypothetical protein
MLLMQKILVANYGKMGIPSMNSSISFRRCRVPLQVQEKEISNQVVLSLP